MLRTIIVEDEKNNRETLRSLLAEFCPEVELCGMAASVDEALPLVRSLRPDLLFLDIELQTGTGFDLLAQLGTIDFELVFTTAFEQYAIKAIKFSSLDYLLKPIDLEELQAAVAKAEQRKRQSTQQMQLDVLLSHLRPGGLHSRRICLAAADGLEFIETSDILYCEANGAYTTFYITAGRKITVSKNLKEYERLLDDQHFMRVHNSYVVNLLEVRRFVRTDGGYILMKNEAKISLSPRKRQEFLDRMGELG